MPRQRKIEMHHDKVVPLSLPEVQLAVTDAIDGDDIDEEAVHRAVLGYRLLLEGSLTNSKGETTRVLTGHGGWYRNVMRGVAQIFGIERRGDVNDQIVRVNPNEDSSDLEECSRTAKRRRLDGKSRTENVNANEDTSDMEELRRIARRRRRDGKSRPEIVNADEDTSDMEAFRSARRRRRDGKSRPGIVNADEDTSDAQELRRIVRRRRRDAKNHPEMELATKETTVSCLVANDTNANEEISPPLHHRDEEEG